MKQYTCIVNPIAGKGGYRKYLPTLLSLFTRNHCQYQVFFTKYSGHGRTISEQYRTEVNQIVCFGGDGTVNEVLQGQINSSAPVSIVPCGSGNDIAASLGITPQNAFQTLFHGISKRISLAKVNGQSFMGVASCGFDTHVNQIANRFPTIFRGTKFLYIMAILLTCFTYRAPFMSIHIDHHHYKGRFLLMAVGHGDRYGGGMRITPKAIREDGMLDVCLIRDTNRIRLLSKLPLLTKGRHLILPEVTYKKAKTIAVNGNLAIFADGEYRSVAPAKYWISDATICMVVPK